MTLENVERQTLLDEFHRMVEMESDRAVSLARSFLRRESSFLNAELDATDLAQDTFVRLLSADTLPAIESSAHFLNILAGTMRRVLVDHARAKKMSKRQGINVTLDEQIVGGAGIDVDIFALDEGLNQLAKTDPTVARVVELRYFGGFSLEEVAELMNMKLMTVRRNWNKGRQFLYEFLQPAT